MTNREVLKLNRAFELLENQPVNGELKPTNYSFGKGVEDIVRNLRLLQPVTDDLEKQRVMLVRPLLEKIKARKTAEEAKLVVGIDPTEPEYQEFMADWNPILDKESEYKPHVFSQGRLRLDKNDIPQSVLLALTPVLKED